MNPTPLIAISDLTFESWKFFTKNWKALLKRTAWFIPLLVIYFALFAVSRFLKMPALMVLNVFFVLMGELILIMHVDRGVLALDAPEHSSPSKNLPLSNVVIPGIIIFLLSVLACMGGTLLFVLPGIWLAVSFYFSHLFLLEDNLRATDALKASFRLVKGRWWATFGRFLVPAIFFGAISGLTMLAVVFVLGMFFSLIGLLVTLALPPAILSVGILTATVIGGLLSALVYFAYILFAISIQQIVVIKLFHSLKASQPHTDKNP